MPGNNILLLRMYAPYGPFFAIIPEILPDSVAGSAMAMINSFGGLGSFVGVYIVGWIRAGSGGNTVAFAFMGGCLILAAILTMILKVAYEEKPTGATSASTTQSIHA